AVDGTAERHVAAGDLDLDPRRVERRVLGQPVADVLADALVRPDIALGAAAAETALAPLGLVLLSPDIVRPTEVAEAALVADAAAVTRPFAILRAVGIKPAIVIGARFARAERPSLIDAVIITAAGIRATVTAAIGIARPFICSLVSLARLA